MSVCPKCGAPVMVRWNRIKPGPNTSAHKETRTSITHPLVLDAEPHERGQYVSDGTHCVAVKDWASVRQHKLPVYRRHNTHCPKFYEQREQQL